MGGEGNGWGGENPVIEPFRVKGELVNEDEVPAPSHPLIPTWRSR